jgi:putative addiction module killer protein
MYPIEYILPEGLQATPEFSRWFMGLRDPTNQHRIMQRLRRLAQGNRGDCKMIDHNLFELRLHHGPGWRVYFCKRGSVHVLLLTGGDKWSQFRDIAVARQLRDRGAA